MSQPKRLLHVTTVPMTLRFLRGQVAYMKEQGYVIEVVSSPGEELESFAREEGIQVQEVPMERRIAPVRDLIALVRLWRKIRQIGPDIVHSHTPKGGLLGMCAAALAGVPVRCYHLRGLPMMSASGPKRSLLRWAERLSCGLADEIFCVSESLRDVALAEGLCKPGKIRVLAGGSGNGVDSYRQYNPSNQPERLEVLRQIGVAEDSLVIGFVGRLVRDKGIIELAGAWKLLRERHPKAVLVLVGPRETGDAVPVEVLHYLDSDSRVLSLGIVKTAAPLYAAFDLVVLPTYREGFPNVLLEAAAMELPVVATAVPGCVDAVEDGVTGTLVAPRDISELVDAIERYLSAAALREKHGKAARRRVLADFAQERIWSSLAERYAALTSGDAPVRVAARRTS